MFRCAICLLAALFLSAFSGDSRVLSHYRINCPGLARHKKIISLHINLVAMNFEDVRPIPQGWTMTVLNDPSLHSKLDADTSIGSGAIDCSELEQIRFSLRDQTISGVAASINGSIR